MKGEGKVGDGKGERGRGAGRGIGEGGMGTGRGRERGGHAHTGHARTHQFYTFFNLNYTQLFESHTNTITLQCHVQNARTYEQSNKRNFFLFGDIFFLGGGGGEVSDFVVAGCCCF